MTQHEKLRELAFKNKLRILICGSVPSALTSAVEDEKDLLETLDNYLVELRKHILFTAFVQKLARNEARFTLFSSNWLNQERWKGRPVQNRQQDIDAAKNSCMNYILPDGGKPRMFNRDKTITLDFEMLLQLRQYWFLDDLKGSGARILSLPERSPLFFWLRDPTDIAAKAVFRFDDGSKPPTQFSFLTDDHSLLRSFHDLFNVRWEKATRIAAEDNLPEWLSMLDTKDSKPDYAAWK
jgi:hypothetical protein